MAIRFMGTRVQGFTLVELITTLIIIALIGAVAGPVFFNVSAFRESGFFDETISSIRYAQKLAVATGCTVRVQITAGGFTLLRPANVATCNTGPYATAVVDPSGNAATFTRTAPSGVTFLTTADFTFTSSGTASVVPDPLTISIGSHSFRVYGQTGFVQRQ